MLIEMKHLDIHADILRNLANASTCDRAKVGCIILKDNRIVSTGYNGSLPGHEHCSSKKKETFEKNPGGGLSYKVMVDDNHLLVEGHCIRTVHAEQNAICNAAKNGVSLEGCTLMVTHSPCPVCTKLIIMAGIKKVYYLKPYRLDENPFKDSIPMEEVDGRY